MDECIHGLTHASCTICLHGPERDKPPTIEATFKAKFGGDCPSCNLPIYEGQVIHKLSTERYVHQGCE